MMDVKKQPASEKEQKAISILQNALYYMPRDDLFRLLGRSEIIGELKNNGIDYKQLMDVAV